MKQVYEVDCDRAFKSVEGFKSLVILWPSTLHVITRESFGIIIGVIIINQSAANYLFIIVYIIYLQWQQCHVMLYRYRFVHRKYFCASRKEDQHPVVTTIHAHRSKAVHRLAEYSSMSLHQTDLVLSHSSSRMILVSLKYFQYRNRADKILIWHCDIGTLGLSMTH